MKQKENKVASVSAEKPKRPSKNTIIFARIIFTLLGGLLGWGIMEAIIPLFPSFPTDYRLVARIASAILLGLVLLFTAKPIMIGLLMLYKKIEGALSKYSPRQILMGAIGLVLGLAVTIALFLLLINPYMDKILGLIITIIIGSILCFLGILVGGNLFAQVITAPATNVAKTSEPANSADNYIVDSSSLIDGRILDIVRTGFVRGRVIVPDFILKEVSVIADSNDMLKKNRGRRGLDILAELQKEKGIRVDILENDNIEASIDTKLLKLAEVLVAPIITVDFNLNKVAQVKSIKILNINELAQAIKPITLPGEKMTVQIVKAGKEYGQGVAYLEDGTMIVVENGGSNIGQSVEVTVTTAMQTAAGRMIFARIIV